MRQLAPRIAGALLVVSMVLPEASAAQPSGYEQILPRGRIAAIDAPTYVGALEAQIPSKAWVLGFMIEGRAFAYSLNLMNAHEVVNDTAGGQPFAAVW